jgi:hypothetical protein
MEKQILDDHRAIYYIHHAIQRTQSMVLEERQDGGYQQSIPLSDLIPKKCKDQRGTFHITVRFTPDE